MMRNVVLVTPLPDETFYSLIARIAILNSMGSQRLSKILFNEMEIPRAADSKLDFDKFLEFTFSAYGSIEEFSAQHTNLNYRKLISCPLKTFENYKYWNNKVLNKKLSLIEASNIKSNTWKWCSSCLEKDIEEHGISFWRRQHQLPGVYICDRHFKSLLMINIPYRMRQQRYLLPHQIPLSLKRNTTYENDVDIDKTIKLGQVSKNLLHFNDQKINQAAFRETLKNNFREMNFLIRNNFVTNNCLESLLNYYKKLISIKEIAELLRKKNLGTLIHNILTSNDVMASNPILFPVLISWGFENWIDFKNKYEWECMMSLPCSTVVINEVSSNRTLYRSICKTFISQENIPSRKLFWEKNYKVCRWLSKYDPAWFNSKLPLQNWKQLSLKF